MFFCLIVSDMEKLIVPIFVQYELYQWISRERGSSEARAVVGSMDDAVIIPLDTSISLFAVGVSKKYHLTTADAMISATSQKNDALLVISDLPFKSLEA